MKKSMADVAAKAAVNSPQTFRRKEIEGELNFISDLDALDVVVVVHRVIHLHHDGGLGAVLDHRRNRDLRDVQLLEIGEVVRVGGQLDVCPCVVADHRRRVHGHGHAAHHRVAEKAPATETPVDIHR